MLDKLLELLRTQYDGAPAWGWLVGFVFLHLEWWLPRTKKVAADSILELIPDLMLKLGGNKLGPVAKLLKRAGSTKRKCPPPLPEPL